MKAKQVTSGLLGAALALCIALACLAALLNACGTSEELMSYMLRRHAPPSSTGLPQDDYAPIARMITSYLDGETEEFQYAVVDTTGTAWPLFHAYEQLHMADCLSLFRLCRAVLLFSALGAAILVPILLALRQRRRSALGCLVGSGAVLVLVLAIGVWAAIDFSGPFVLFHKLSFQNNLWQLNPATDMLIRLMPLSFFIHYAALVGVTWLVVLLSMGFISLLIFRKKRF